MADMRKSLSKLKVIELKEKLQELGKSPKGLKADLINQLAEAYEEQAKGLGDNGSHSAPLQSYPTAELANPSLLAAEANDPQHYYQQPVPQYSMPGQQVYEQTPPYLQNPYVEPQYQYPTHQVFSPTHEQQYTQSSTPYQITAQLSPRMAPQMSPQLSPQMANQMTQQLSPQMGRQYRSQEFQSPHRGFQSNESDAYHQEFSGQPVTESIPHFGHQIPHLDMHSIPQSQPPIPTVVPHMHRPPVIEGYVPDIQVPVTQNMPQNIPQGLAADLNVYKESESFIPSHPSVITTQHLVQAPTDMIDFDDVALGVDPHHEVQYSQPLGAFDAHQNQSQYQMTDTSTEYQRDVSDGQTYSQQTINASNPMQEMDNEDTNDDTNEATNEDSTDLETNDGTNQSFPTDEIITENVKPIETNFSVQQIMGQTTDGQELISNANNTSVLINANQLPQQTEQFEESSGDSVETDVDSAKDENQIAENTESIENIKSDVIKAVEEPKEEPKEVELYIETEPQVSQTNVEVFEHKVEANVSETLSTQTTRFVESPVMSHIVDSVPEVTVAKSESKDLYVKSDKSPVIKTTTITAVKVETAMNEPIRQNGDISGKKLSKNQKKKQRKKLQSMRRRLVEEKQKQNNATESDDKMDIEDEEEEEVEIEYIPEQMEQIARDRDYLHFLKVFDKFRTGESDKSIGSQEADVMDPVKKMMERKKPVELELKDDDEKRDGEHKVSKRKQKQMTRMTVSELKQRVSHPELVEMHDVTARDPLLLLHLKSTRNSVPVPRHWCYKRKYLQGKRGFEKPPFKLPEFIRKTGIMEMRQALQEKEESKSLKAQMREKIRPKMGKIDIDYQKLHDAFFKWQTKPKMTIHGDLYYEGKEFETRLKEKKPGELSNELRTSLGMPTGPNAHKCPPPWLIAMQRYGPPPSYPNIKIPGLNAPIPDGCSFGYHAGGWGKPPVDEYGRPLYGDVFGVTTAGDQNLIEEEVDRTLWGEMEEESEEEEEEESEEEETEETAGAPKPASKEVDETGFATPAEGLITPSGLASVPTGTETPDMIELRKRKQIEAEMESSDNPSLYTVIPEKKGDKIGREMMGSAHTYDMTASTLRKGQGVDVAIDPSDLEAGVMDSASMAAKYEQTMKERTSHLDKEDLSDMVAEHAARHKRKKPQDSSKSNKKYQFKF